MFTGIIEAQAKVLQKSSHTLFVERPSSFDDVEIGSSIAVNGVCLSIIEFDDRSMKFDVGDEPWSRTNLGQLEQENTVNLERALSANSRFEGHIVQGHVEAVCEIIDVSDTSNGKDIRIALPDDLSQLVVEKGSITLDGISLTIAKKNASTATVSLIPHTLENTNLGRKIVGDSVNLETDILGKYVHAMIAS